MQLKKLISFLGGRHHHRSCLVAFVWVFFASSLAFASANCVAVQKGYDGTSLTGTPSSDDQLGLWLARKGENECALKSFLAATAKDASSWEANFNAGQMYATLGDPRSGSVYLARAVALDPGLLRPRLVYGEVEEALGQTENAERIYRDGLVLNPSSPLLLDHLANLLAAQGAYKAAINCWQNALTLDPHNTQYQLSLGVTYTKDQQYARANAILEELTKSDPTLEAAFFSLGTSYARQGDFIRSANAFRTALQLKPDDAEAQLSQAKVYIAILRYSDARPLLLKDVANHPDNTTALILLGQTNRFLGSLDESELELRKAATVMPQSYDAQYNLGVTLRQTGHLEEAVTHLKLAIAIRPESLEAHFELSKLYKIQHENALAEQQAAIINAENSANANQIKALVLGNEGSRALSAGNVPVAIQNYKAALALDPKNARLYYDISLAYKKNGDTAQEKQALLDAETFDTSFGTAHNQLGLIYLQAGETQQAEGEFLKAIVSNLDDASALSNLGVLYAKQGETEKAERFLARAIESDPSLISAHVNLGLILAMQGKLADALHVVNDALSISPNDEGAKAAKRTIEDAINNVAPVHP